jgi:hypothetical protein
MKLVRLILSLAVFVPGFAWLGIAAAWDSYFSVWGGEAIGGAIGVFFGLAFGGMLPRMVADWCFGPEEPANWRVLKRPFSSSSWSSCSNAGE